MPYYPREEFKNLAEEITSSGKPERMTVRKLLLNYFHQERRSRRVVPWIRTNLNKLGLECYPDFEAVYIDGDIELRKRPTVKSRKKGSSAPQQEPALGRPYPVPRLTLLPAANRQPISIHRDAKLQRAITEMLLHDYSQLPVMQNERDVDGMVSWRSIVSARTFGSDCQTVRDCMIKQVEIVSHDMPLFDAVKTVMSREVILVRGPERRIVGLVTAADIGEQFISFAEPFMILEQIENHLRLLLDGRFTSQQLRAALDPSDSERDVDAISDLTFGSTYGCWRTLIIGKHSISISIVQLSRKRLDEVRRIRNDVMHFDPDGISGGDLETLRETARFDTFTQFRKTV